MRACTLLVLNLYACMPPNCQRSSASSLELKPCYTREQGEGDGGSSRQEVMSFLGKGFAIASFSIFICVFSCGDIGPQNFT